MTIEERLAEALRRIVAEYGEIIPAYSGQARELLAAYDRDGGWTPRPEEGWTFDGTAGRKWDATFRIFDYTFVASGDFTMVDDVWTFVPDDDGLEFVPAEFVLAVRPRPEPWKGTSELPAPAKGSK